MPASWVSAGIGAVGLLNSLNQPSGSGSNAYSPQGLTSADMGWQNAFNSQVGNASNVASTASPAYQQSYQQAQGINYAPYQYGANQAGQMYGNLANQAGGLSSQLGQGANQIYQTAFDPQNALFQQQQQVLGDQVNAGQAQRGLGNSAVGGQEYNNAMSNFDINWQNNQLQRQTTGLSAMDSAAQGANTIGSQGATYAGLAGSTPITAEQYIAGQPAAAANSYGQNVGNLNTMYQNLTNQANSYMQPGASQTTANNAFNAQQTASGTQALLTGLNGLTGTATTPSTTTTPSVNSSAYAYGQNYNTATDPLASLGYQSSSAFNPYTSYSPVNY